MEKRRSSGDGMIRKREDGHREGRIDELLPADLLRSDALLLHMAQELLRSLPELFNSLLITAPQPYAVCTPSAKTALQKADWGASSRSS